jgi:hypothetical protein
VRIEKVIAINAADGVGPTRLTLLTAGSSKLPVVVMAQADGPPAYYVFDVAGLQGALTNQLSATPVREAVQLSTRQPRPAVDKGSVATSVAGDPVEENGRLFGVIADDAPERREPGEEDLARGGTTTAEASPERKRGLWQRLSRSS